MTRKSLATLAHGRWLMLAGAASVCAGTVPNLVTVDFDGANRGKWTAAGETFGPGPARGTLPNQIDGEGFKGEGHANSACAGDDFNIAMKTTGLA